MTEKEDPLANNSQHAMRVEEARRFLANAKWLYDTISERGVKPADGRRPKMRIKRFTAGAPHGCIREILDLLTDSAPYINPTISGTTVPGKWKPSLSWFRKDSGNATVGARTATVTLIQDLIPDYEEGDLLDVEAGGNCSTLESYEYVWDASDVVGPEAPYPQGVTYSIQGVNRDDETGLFSYVIRKSVALSQHYGPYVSAVSRTTQRTTEIWRNAYQIPSGLPEEGTTVEDGTTTTVEISVNDDCTYNIQKTVTVTLEHDGAESCGKTILEHTHEVTTGGNDEPLGEAPAASGGIVKTHTSKAEEDGTYTNTERTICELEKICHSVSTAKTIHGTRVTVTDRNVSFYPNLCNIDVGGSVQYEHTDGGLLNVSTTNFDISDSIGDLIAASRQATIYDTRCSCDTIVAEAGDETATAIDGVLTGYQYERLETGAWKRTESVATELEVKEATVSKAKTVFGETVTTVNCHVDLPLGAPDNGETIQNKKTDGGLYDTYSTKEKRNRVGWCHTQSHTPFETTTRSLFRANDTVEHGNSFGKSTMSELCDDGKYDGCVITVAPHEQQEVRSYYEDFNVVTTSIKTRNAEGPVSDCSVGYVDGIAVSSQSTLTDLGTYDTVVVREDPKNHWDYQYVLSSSCSITYYYLFANYEQIPSNPFPVPGVGQTLADSGISVSRDKFGLFSGRIQVTYRDKTNSEINNDKIPEWVDEDGTVTETRSRRSRNRMGLPVIESAVGIRHFGFTTDLRDLRTRLQSAMQLSTLDGFFEGPSYHQIYLPGGTPAFSYTYYTNVVIMPDKVLEHDANLNVTQSVNVANP